jgi:ubiquinone/menaquinone biosynthesis C-methylase UbiE
MNSEHEAWQKQVYDSRKEAYRASELPSIHGPHHLLLTYREHMRMIEKLEIQKGQAVLDLGCSSGDWLHLMTLRYGCRGTGMDISSEAIAAAKARNPYGHAFLEGSAEKGLPFEDALFDRMTCFDVLEHIQNPTATLREVHRILKPGGRALFHIPVTDIRGSMDWIYSKLSPSKFVSGLKQAGHDYSVMKTRAGYESAFREAGFTILQARRFNSLFQNIFDYHVTHRLLNRVFYVWGAPFSLYHRLVAPVIELAIAPDLALRKLDIGASVYILAQKP